MAHITQLSVERNYTLNLGNYESMRLGATATIHLDEGDDPDDAYEKAVEFIEDKLAAEMEVMKDDD